jgi:hypothetical protein
VEHLIVNALATHRLTRLVTTDAITEPVRKRVWEKYPPETTKLGYFVTCNWCTSIWVGAGVAIADTVAPRAWRVVALALAASSAVGLVEEKM